MELETRGGEGGVAGGNRGRIRCCRCVETEKKQTNNKQNKNNPKSVGMDHFWFFSWLESQSRPSYRPSPLVAHVAWMYQLRWRSACRPSLSVISAAFMALGRSWEEEKLSSRLQQRNYRLRLLQAARRKYTPQSLGIEFTHNGVINYLNCT